MTRDPKARVIATFVLMPAFSHGISLTASGEKMQGTVSRNILEGCDGTE